MTWPNATQRCDNGHPRQAWAMARSSQTDQRENGPATLWHRRHTVVSRMSDLPKAAGKPSRRRTTIRIRRPFGLLCLPALLVTLLMAQQAAAVTQPPTSAVERAIGPSTFATLGRPVGVAATATALLVTQAQRKTVKAIDSAGNVSLFTTLPTTDKSIEPYIAVSSGLGGFPLGNVYVVVRQKIFQISPNGSNPKLFKKISGLSGGNNGITFDTVGTFGFNMLITDRRGPVWTVTSSKVATQIVDVMDQIKGTAVAPLTFGNYGGQLLVASEFAGQVFAISPTDFSISTVGSWESAEGVDMIPTTVCEFDASGGAYFVAMEDESREHHDPVLDFTGLEGQALAPGEITTSIGVSDGLSDFTTFSGPIGTPDLEGSDFFPCSGR